MAKAFAKDGDDMGLKNETVQFLVAADIDTSAILGLCSAEDIDQFQLSKGQTLVVKHWVSCLTTEDVGSAAPPSVTSQTGNTLDNLLEEHAGNTASPPLGKPLLVVDHVNCVVGGVSDAPERQVYSQGDTQLFKALLRSCYLSPVGRGQCPHPSGIDSEGKYSFIGGR